LKTPRGNRLVENLALGELVQVHFADVASLKWIGRRRVDCRKHPRPEKVWPVRICAGAFGDRRPLRDLWLPPDHAVLVDGTLISIKYLINGNSVAQIPVNEVSYYHVELPHHDLLLADDLLTESYLDAGDRSNFVNSDGIMRLFPEFLARGLDVCGIWDAYGCAPLIVTGEQLDRVRKRLAVLAIRGGRGNLHSAISGKSA
jgi:Hint domain